jgi:uncharacterized protein (PEP-CTERM system associated)
MTRYCRPFQLIAGGVLFVGALPAFSIRAWADGFKFTPSITLQELYTDNSGGGQNNSQSDVVTQISPGIAVNESGPWSTATINYSPTFNHYDFGTAPDRVDQNFNGVATITPFEDQLKIDISANASEQGATANSNNVSNSLLLASNNRVLYYVGDIIPHFTHHFGDVATLDAYYRLKSANVSDQSIHELPNTSLSSDSLQNDMEVIFGTGERFGQIGAQIDLDHGFGNGSGENTGSVNDKDFLGLQYHFNSLYAATGTIGYQRLHYDASLTTLPFTSEGLIWSVGARATPNPDSTLSVSYGFQEGVYIPTLKMTYSLGPRTIITANYLVQIENELESSLLNLQYLTYNALGQPIDSRTGLPFSLVNPSFGSQNVLFRDKAAQVTVVHQLERSAITLRVVYEKRSEVTGPVAGSAAETVDIGYSRAMSPNLNGSVDIGFTNSRASGVIANPYDRQNLVDLGFSLYWTLSETASVYLNGTFYKPVSNASTQQTTNQVVLGFRKAL